MQDHTGPDRLVERHAAPLQHDGDGGAGDARVRRRERDEPRQLQRRDDRERRPERVVEAQRGGERRDGRHLRRGPEQREGEHAPAPRREERRARGHEDEPGRGGSEQRARGERAERGPAGELHRPEDADDADGSAGRQRPEQQDAADGVAQMARRERVDEGADAVAGGRAERPEPRSGTRERVPPDERGAGRPGEEARPGEREQRRARVAALLETVRQRRLEPRPGERDRDGRGEEEDGGDGGAPPERGDRRGPAAGQPLARLRAIAFSFPLVPPFPSVPTGPLPHLHRIGSHGLSRRQQTPARLDRTDGRGRKMTKRRVRGGLVAGLLAALAAVLAAGSYGAGSGQFQFEPLAASTPCTDGGDAAQPFALPSGYVQTVFAAEGDAGTIDLWDMNTQNETGPHAGRYLYRTHETRGGGQVSVTDLKTGETRIVAQRADWERLDGIVWTPWGTILAAEEVSRASFPDPQAPQALAGLVYEIDPATGDAVALPAVGARSHEGLRFDPQGNLYGISETNAPNGFVYKFVPDRRGDLSSGQLYVLDVVGSSPDRTGEAVWVPLDRTAVEIDSDPAARAAGGTSYSRPEDVETAKSTGNNAGGANELYVAVTGEDRVLKIDLRGDRAYVSDYVRDGLNAPADFDAPDNLALDHAGNLYVSEDSGSGRRGLGDDVWVAVPGRAAAAETVRFASLTDCRAEPTGIYFDRNGSVLYVNVQHRGGDGRDLAVAIAPAAKAGLLPPGR